MFGFTVLAATAALVWLWSVVPYPAWLSRAIVSLALSMDTSHLHVLDTRARRR